MLHYVDINRKIANVGEGNKNENDLPRKNLGKGEKGKEKLPQTSVSNGTPGKADPTAFHSEWTKQTRPFPSARAFSQTLNPHSPHRYLSVKPQPWLLADLHRHFSGLTSADPHLSPPSQSPKLHLLQPPAAPRPMATSSTAPPSSQPPLQWRLLLHRLHPPVERGRSLMSSQELVPSGMCAK